MRKTLKIVSYGEILWDLFPEGKQQGGAPLNVALRLLSLGNEVKMISRLGEDKLAEETCELLKKQGLDQSLIQHDLNLKTGAVDVKLDSTGSASYTIKKPVAWDNIQLTDEAEKAVENADLFIYGSLAARSESSKNTLNRLVQKAKMPVFDVNLRAPHYELQEVVELMEQAFLIKMNDEEIDEICGFMGLNHKNLKHRVNALYKTMNAQYICVTRGANGALLSDGNKVYSHSGFPTKVADTVGAGDSFLAGLLHILFGEDDPEKALDYGCALGSIVASQNGANAKVSQAQIEKLLQKN